MGRKLTIGLLALLTILIIFVSCSETLMDEVRDKVAQDLLEAAGPVGYTVTYDGNGNDGGKAPIDENNYEEGMIATVKGPGTLTLNGSNFIGWNTAANGSGTPRTAGGSFQIDTEDETLYAQWSVSTYTIYFAAEGGSAPSPTSKTVTYGSEYGTLATTSWTGYNFNGWFTAATGGVQSTATTIVTQLVGHNLYAQWTGISSTITLNKTEGTGGTGSVPAVFGSAMSEAIAPTRTGYIFLGYFTAVDGGGDQYYTGSMVSTRNWDKIVNTILYAYWFAPPCPVRKTGQTISYATGDDGDLEAGVAWPDPRFTDNGNGTITDNLTGLVWEQAPPATTSTWDDALSYCDDLTTGGSDWRMPNRFELLSLANYGEANGATWLESKGFALEAENFHWTSTAALGNGYGTAVWFQFLNTGFSEDLPKNVDFLASAFSVRSSSASLPKTGQTNSFTTGDDGDLESGTAWPSPRFVNNGNGSMTDKLTGLMWELSPSSTTRTWTNALTYCNNLTTGDYSDWRLPTVLELVSILNHESDEMNIWLNNQGFSGVIENMYWTSTTHPNNTNIALSIWIGEGKISAEYSKSGKICSWAVRTAE